MKNEHLFARSIMLAGSTSKDYKLASSINKPCRSIVLALSLLLFHPLQVSAQSDTRTFKPSPDANFSNSHHQHLISSNAHKAKTSLGADKSSWNQGMSSMMDSLESEIKGSDTTGEIPEGRLPSSDIVPGEVDAATNSKQVVEPGEVDEPIELDATANESQKNSPRTIEAPKGSISETNLAPAEIGDNYLNSIGKNGLVRWPRSRMPIKVYIEQKSALRGFRNDFPDIVKRAFLDWQDASRGFVSFSFVSEPAGADITCQWSDDPSEMLNSNEGGNAYIIPDENGILSAEIKILTIPPSQMSSIPDAYMKHVALHEIGHALGIAGHSPVQDDIMYGIIMPDDSQEVLSERDKNTLLALSTASAHDLAGKNVDSAQLGRSASSSNPKVQAFKLNNEAAEALNKKDFDLALRKLEEAHKLDSTNKLVSSNLGALYANYGSIAAMTFNLPQACLYYKKSVDLLDGGLNKPVLKQVLENYIKILQMSNQTAELKVMEAKLKTLQ